MHQKICNATMPILTFLSPEGLSLPSRHVLSTFALCAFTLRSGFVMETIARTTAKTTAKIARTILKKIPTKITKMIPKPAPKTIPKKNVWGQF